MFYCERSNSFASIHIPPSLSPPSRINSLPPVLVIYYYYYYFICELLAFYIMHDDTSFLLIVVVVLYKDLFLIYSLTQSILSVLEKEIAFVVTLIIIFTSFCFISIYCVIFFVNFFEIHKNDVKYRYK